MKRLYLLPKADSLTSITGFLMVILLGAFITITYQPAFAAEPRPDGKEQSGTKDMNDMGGKDKGGPCGAEDPPIQCVGVPISPSPNEFGCTTGQQCSLSTQNKTCAIGKKCKTVPSGTVCQCLCKT